MLSFLMKTKLPHLYDRIVSCYFFTVTKAFYERVLREREHPREKGRVK